jgi:CO/xanthine dehydrogenase FAD-binding subunit
MSSDCVPVLISLDAVIEQVGPEGRRELPMAEYYKADGTRHTNAEPGELTVGIRIPLPTVPRRSDYVKWTVRKSIDFPLVSVALRFDLEADEQTLAGVRVVAGVLGAKPRVVSKLDELVGKRLDDPTVAHQIAVMVHKQCKPLENVPYEAAYRRRMIQVLTQRAIAGMA